MTLKVTQKASYPIGSAMQMKEQNQTAMNLNTVFESGDGYPGRIREKCPKETIMSGYTKYRGYTPPRYYYKTVQYRDSKGNDWELNDVPVESVEPMNFLNKYFDKESGKIPYSLKSQIMQDIAIKYSEGGKYFYSIPTMEYLLRNAVDDFTEECSDGGKDITVYEAYQLNERLIARYLNRIAQNNPKLTIEPKIK